MLINYSVGVCRPFWKKMIEFSLQIDTRIIRAILPELKNLFVISPEFEDYTQVFPDQDDLDFNEAWIEGLASEAKSDRNALARFLESPRLQYGRVEVKEDDIEDLLRGITEFRFTIRKTSLKAFDDSVLECGIDNLNLKDESVRIGYFGYLLLAEVQERIICEIA